MWLEVLARKSDGAEVYPFPFANGELDFRPLLRAVAADRKHGRKQPEIARAFQRGVAQGLCATIKALCRERQLDTVVLSGGVFQNELLLSDIRDVLSGEPLAIWTNHAVPPNDGGISLGQAALAAFLGEAPPGLPREVPDA
jgi:hydrogenase maturation protein HypF